jgi:hypothetical protein
LPWFAELNRSLGDVLDEAQFQERLRRNTAQMHELAAEILARAREVKPDIEAGALERALAEFAAPPNSAALLFPACA